MLNEHRRLVDTPNQQSCCWTLCFHFELPEDTAPRFQPRKVMICPNCPWPNWSAHSIRRDAVLVSEPDSLPDEPTLAAAGRRAHAVAPLLRPSSVRPHHASLSAHRSSRASPPRSPPPVLARRGEDAVAAASACGRRTTSSRAEQLCGSTLAAPELAAPRAAVELATHGGAREQQLRRGLTGAREQPLRHSLAGARDQPVRRGLAGTRASSSSAASSRAHEQQLRRGLAGRHASSSSAAASPARASSRSARPHGHACELRLRHGLAGAREQQLRCGLMGARASCGSAMASWAHVCATAAGKPPPAGNSGLRRLLCPKFMTRPRGARLAAGALSSVSPSTAGGRRPAQRKKGGGRRMG